MEDFRAESIAMLLSQLRPNMARSQSKNHRCSAKPKSQRPPDRPALKSQIRAFETEVRERTQIREAGFASREGT
jgi:hypothetical protein